MYNKIYNFLAKKEDLMATGKRNVKKISFLKDSVDVAHRIIYMCYFFNKTMQDQRIMIK